MMLASLSFQTDATTSMHLGVLPNQYYYTDGSSNYFLSPVGFWIALAVIYHFIVFWIAGGKLGSIKVSSTSSSSFSDSICPKRKGRWYKCAKRCRKRCAKTTPTEECYFTKCAMNLIKLHLPPPLPLNAKKTKNKSGANKEKQSLVEEPSRTSSSSDKAGDIPEKVRTATEKTVKRRVVRSSVPLIDLARMQYWESIVQQATRRGAKYRDSDGLYPLHWACSGGPPVKVVETLLDAYPSAARKTDQEGSTALHFAAHYSASTPVVKAVLQAHPKAASTQDRYGRTPLYHAVEKSAGLDVIMELVQANPSAVTLPCLPFDRRDVPISRGVAQRTPLYMAWSAVLLDRKTRETRRGKKWDKARLLLEAAYDHAFDKDHTIAQRDDFKFLHAAIAFDLYLPEEIFKMAVSMYPEQLEEQDPCDRIPLLQAAKTKFFSRQRSDDVLAHLLLASPSGAQARDHRGKSALQLALESGKPWSAGVRRLFEANPDAIHWTDNAGLSPAMAAATVTTTSSEDATIAVSDDVVDENPLGLLTTKEKELLRRRRFEFLKLSADEQALTGMEQLSTVFELMTADPSVLPQSGY